MQFLSSAELHLGEFFMAEPGKVMLYTRKQRGFACYRLRSRGFTMVELLITIVLIGILTTIATSMMRDWAVSNDVNATAAAVESAFDQARQAAVSRGRPVLMMPRAITGNRWKGIVYFVDTDMDGALTDNDEVLIKGSKDDLEDNNDPLENLHNDSPISNCICADRDFTIHQNPIELKKEPVIILCATDGCFGYYQTPMHFEYVLKSCLQRAKNEKEWEQMIIDEVSKVTGDDCSLSLIAKGYSSFDELKKSMKLSSVVGFPQLVEQEQTIAWAEQELAKEKEKYEHNIITGWNSYKQNYMKFINNEDNGNA